MNDKEILVVAKQSNVSADVLSKFIQICGQNFLKS
jgi:hypothetical protein